MKITITINELEYDKKKKEAMLKSFNLRKREKETERLLNSVGLDLWSNNLMIKIRIWVGNSPCPKSVISTPIEKKANSQLPSVSPAERPVAQPEHQRQKPYIFLQAWMC